MYPLLIYPVVLSFDVLFTSIDLLGLLCFLLLLSVFEIDYYFSLFLLLAVDSRFLMYSALLLDLALFSQTELLFALRILFNFLEIRTGL